MRKLVLSCLSLLFPSLSFSQSAELDESARLDLLKRFSVRVVAAAQEPSAAGLLMTIKDNYAYVLTVFHAFKNEDGSEVALGADTVNIEFPLSLQDKSFQAKIYKRDVGKDYIIYKSVQTLAGKYAGFESVYYPHKLTLLGRTIQVLGEPLGEDKYSIKSLFVSEEPVDEIVRYKASTRDNPQKGNSGGGVFTPDNILLAMHQGYDPKLIRGADTTYHGLRIAFVMNRHPELLKYHIDWRPFRKKAESRLSDVKLETDLPITLTQRLRETIILSGCDSTIKAFYETQSLMVTGTYEKERSNKFKGEVEIFLDNESRLRKKYSGENAAAIAENITNGICKAMGLQKRRRPFLLYSAGLIAAGTTLNFFRLREDKKNEERDYNLSVSPQAIEGHVDKIESASRGMRWSITTALITGGGGFLAYKKWDYYKNDLMERRK